MQEKIIQENYRSLRTLYTPNQKVLKVIVYLVYLLASALRVGTTPLGGDSGWSGWGKNLKEPALW